MLKTSSVYKYLQGKEPLSYQFKRVLTAWATKSIDNRTTVPGMGHTPSHLQKDAIAPNPNKIVYQAEGIKKPVTTRIGKLLKLQHKQWMRDQSSLERVRRVPALMSAVKNVNSRCQYMSLLVQSLLIFGFFDLNDINQCKKMIDFIESSNFYKNYVKINTHVLPNIDRLLTLMLEDRTLYCERKDEWSTLASFRLFHPIKRSEADNLVNDFASQVFKIPTPPIPAYQCYAKSIKDI